MQGDSGGALLCPSPDGRTQYLAGITSTGFGCGRPGIPSLWTKLVEFLPWVRQIVQNPQGGRSVGTDSNCQGFRCRLGDCIFNWLRCDAQYDCSTFDGSDEAGCNYNKGLSSTNRTLLH